MQGDVPRDEERPRPLRFPGGALAEPNFLLEGTATTQMKSLSVAGHSLTPDAQGHVALKLRLPESGAGIAIDAQFGDGVAVRFLYRDGDSGYDSLHGACMLERLAGAMDMEPVVQYEYDFVGGAFGDRRALDSAFVVTYDKPILGERQWRQRTVTIVGNGTSLCAITYAPVTLWKKSAPTRALLDAVLASVTFR